MKFIHSLILITLVNTAFAQKITFEAGDGTGKVERLTGIINQASEVTTTPQEQWKLWRTEWLKQKKGANVRTQGLPELEQYRQHRAWLLYQAPSEDKIFQYLRLEDLFILSTKLLDWKMAQTYLNQMSELAPEIQYGVENLTEWLNQLNTIPSNLLDRTAALSKFKEIWEKEKKYDTLAYFFADTNNTLRNSELSIKYAKLHIDTLQGIERFKWMKKWEVLSKNDNETQWYKKYESHPLMKYWWSSQIAKYCEDLQMKTPLSKDGVIIGESCIK